MKINRFLLIILMIAALTLAACSSGGDESDVLAPEPTAVSNVLGQSEEGEKPDAAKSKGGFDAAAMVENLEDFVLRIEDMPNEYKIATDGEQHLTNQKLINTVGEVEGKRYMAATGRVDGWSLVL
jgi:hypothetical protein